MFKIKNLGTKAEIYLWGEIIDDTDASWLIRENDGTIGYQYPTKVKEQLDGLKGLPIDVHIASDGGDVGAGIAIYNMLTNHDAPVTVYIDRWGASIASFIAFAGSKIVMPENTFLMIHNPYGGGFGEADYLRSIADWLDKLKNMIAETYVKHAKTADIETIKALMDKETWFTAKEAFEMFDNVELAEKTDLKAVAQYKSGFKTAPKMLSEETTEEVKEEVAEEVAEEIKKEEVTVEEQDDIKKKIMEVLQEAFNYEEKG